MFMAVSITETLLAVLLATYVYSHDCWPFWIGIGPPIPIDGRGFLYDGYAGQEAGLKRRSTISHPRVEPHDLAASPAAPASPAKTLACRQIPAQPFNPSIFSRNCSAILTSS